MSEELYEIENIMRSQDGIEERIRKYPRDIYGLRQVIKNPEFEPLSYWSILAAATNQMALPSRDDGGEADLCAHEARIEAELREIRETKAPIPLGVKSRTDNRIGDDDATASEDDDDGSQDDDDDTGDDDDDDDEDEDDYDDDMEDNSVEEDEDDDFMP